MCIPPYAPFAGINSLIKAPLLWMGCLCQSHAALTSFLQLSCISFVICRHIKKGLLYICISPSPLVCTLCHWFMAHVYTLSSWQFCEWTTITTGFTCGPKHPFGWAYSVYIQPLYFIWFIFLASPERTDISWQVRERSRLLICHDVSIDLVFIGCVGSIVCIGVWYWTDDFIFLVSLFLAQYTDFSCMLHPLQHKQIAYRPCIDLS